MCNFTKLDGCRLIADWGQCMQNDSMPVQITIRDVPNEVRDELAARAALEGQSMQEFLRAELLRLVAKPSMKTWLTQVRDLAEDSGRQLSAVDILNARDADRK